MTEPVVRRLSDIPALPAGVPEFVVDEWELARSGYGALEEEARALAMLDHPEFYALWKHEEDLPSELEIAEMNPRLHLLMHQIGEKQLIENNPPEAAAAMEHLMSQGLSRHRALHMLLEGVSDLIFHALRDRKPADNEAYVRHLQRLTRARAAGVVPFQRPPGRNDPCPCGSGKKFKVCCLESSTGPVINSASGRMVLYSDFTTEIREQKVLPADDSLYLLENLAAVAYALEEMGLPEAAADAYRQLIDAAEAHRPEYLVDALDDCQNFTLSHAGYEDQGIAVTERLIQLAEDPAAAAHLRLDLADLHARKGARATADAIYRDALAADTGDPYIHLRWAGHLGDTGRVAEAAAVYQALIDRKGMGDPPALRKAREHLAELQAHGRPSGES